MNDDISKALEILKRGGLILYPTDTIWGIGCDATNAEAVAKIYTLKKRSQTKSMSVLLDTDNKLQSYVHEVPDLAYQLIEYAEKPLTIIYSGARNLAANLIAEDGSIGIRMVKHAFCEKLLQRFRKPIVSTSANISGEPTAATFDEISEEIKSGVDYVVEFEQEKSTPKEASTIIKLGIHGSFEFIRR